MTDDIGPEDSTMEDDPAGDGGRPRLLVILAGLAAAIVIAVVVAIIVSGDDADAPSTSDVTTDVETTVAPETTESTETTETTEVDDTTAPTDAPETTAAPETTQAPETTVAPSDELAFTIADIEDGGTIPVEFTCDGANEVPAMDITAVPEGTRQLAFALFDPDAPTENPFVHWLVYGIPPDATEITEDNDDFTYGLNDAGTSDWFGPCPPPGEEHGYVFGLVALDEVFDLPADLDGREVGEAIDSAVILAAEIIATYERQ